MKKKILMSSGLLCLFLSINAHDDLVYRTRSGWSFDIGSQAHISQTVDASFLGGACVGDYDGDGLADLCENK